MKYDITLDTFVISDTHFGHKAVMKKEPIRKLALKQSGFTRFDELQIYRWNNALSADDKILHLGDLYFDMGYKYLPRLHGEKLLIVGNNDIGKFERVEKMQEWQVCHKLKLQIPEAKRVKARLRAKFGKSQLKDPYANAIVLDLGKERVMFSHFPVFNRKRDDRFYLARDVLDEAYKICDCSLNIHGHTHTKKTYNRFCINACCEELDFTPVRLREIVR